MYRCVACDNPAQMGHAENCPAMNDFIPNVDPWGWQEEPEKLDIQAGVRIKMEEETAYA